MISKVMPCRNIISARFGNYTTYKCRAFNVKAVGVYMISICFGELLTVGKGKAVCAHVMMELRIRSSLTSALEGGEWLTRSGCFTPENETLVGTEYEWVCPGIGLSVILTRLEKL